MSRIHILNERLCNLIAAGEVVERPSAVVKELVENSIDAHSTEIIIKITNGGMDQIIVNDNGFGMNIDDLELAFQAHATSKLNNEHQLFAIETLGFRGEAIPSIAAISKITITSNDGQGANTKTVAFGTGEPSKPAARETGTTVIVEALFYRTPARLKHLKSVEYESSLITDLLQKFALSHPNISFSYWKDDKQVFVTKGSGSLEPAIYALYGYETFQQLIPVEYHDYDFAVKGFISNTHFSKSTKQSINLFINQRMIYSASLVKTIVESYHDHFAPGRYPLVILNITTDPHLADVNVSPTKWSVRISKEQALKELLATMINNALQVNQQPVTHHNTKLPSIEQSTLYLDETFTYNTQVNEEFVEQPTNQLQVIGQLHGKYIIAGTIDALWIIDQHAAQERYNYEKFKQCLEQPLSHQQEVLTVPFELTLSQIQQLAEITEHLALIGIIIESYGIKSVIVRAIPLWMHDIDVNSVVIDLIDWLTSGETINVGTLRKHTLATLACHSSVRFNEFLDRSQMQQLVNNLMKCDNPFNCPHGRPTVVKIDDKQLLKEFNRE